MADANKEEASLEEPLPQITTEEKLQIEQACMQDSVSQLQEVFYSESHPTHSELQRRMLKVARGYAVGIKAFKILEYVLTYRAATIEVLETLVENGFDINEPPEAIFDVVGDENVVKWCLDHGATVNFENENLLESTTASGNIQSFKLLLSRGAPLGRHCLHWASRKAVLKIGGESQADTEIRQAKALNMVRYLLLELKLDPNQQDQSFSGGRVYMLGTPLHYCIRPEGSGLEVVRLLLENGADPSLNNAHGCSALKMAENDGRQQFVDIVKSMQQMKK